LGYQYYSQFYTMTPWKSHHRTLSRISPGIVFSLFRARILAGFINARRAGHTGHAANSAHKQNVEQLYNSRRVYAHAADMFLQTRIALPISSGDGSWQGRSNWSFRWRLAGKKQLEFFRSGSAVGRLVARMFAAWACPCTVKMTLEGGVFADQDIITQIFWRCFLAGKKQLEFFRSGLAVGQLVARMSAAWVCQRRVNITRGGCFCRPG
jgi:hypothetical protein